MNIRSICSFALACFSFTLATASTEPLAPSKSAGQLPSSNLMPPAVYIEAAPKHGFEAPIAAANQDAQQAVLRGLSHLINFWDEAAYLEFKKALFHDPDCPMAHWGLVISTITPHDEKTPEKEASLKKLESILAQESAPEKELEYIRALYVLLRDGPRDAAKVFQRISDKWRHDEIAPLFAVMLMRDGFDDGGKYRPGQQQAIQILDRMLANNPDSQPAHFLRGLLEETNPVVTLDTLESVNRALELSPDAAPANHLLGHLLFRLGHYTKAEEQFNKAAELYQEWQKQSHLSLADNEGYIRAMMYRAVSEFCRGDLKKAQNTAMEICQLPIDLGRIKSKGISMLLWEARALPLRLCLSANTPVDKKNTEASFPPALHSRQTLLGNSETALCLQFASMRLAYQDKNQEALLTHYQNINNLSEALNASREQAQSECAESYWLRALSLCEQYLIEGKSMRFPQSAETWYREAADKYQLSSMLLPPILPYPAEWKLALWYLEKGQYANCIEACDAALKKFPNHALIIHTREEAQNRLTTQASSDSTTIRYNIEKQVYHPFLDPVLLVSWSKLTPDKIKPDIEEAIKQGMTNIDAICQLDPDKPEALTYENTFQALESATEALSIGWARVAHLESLMDSPALRNAITEVTPEVVKFQSSIPLNAKLWQVIKKASECEWVKDLSPIKQRFIQETLFSFKNKGADLPDESKELFTEIETDLVMTTKWFGDNVLDATNEWELIVTDPAELEGLPDSNKEHARLDALNKGYGSKESPAWRFTLPRTSSAPVMKFAESSSLRRKIWEASNNIGFGKKDNEPLIFSILRLRQQKVELLGYKTFADYTTANRMAQTGDKALNFINELTEKVKPYFDKESQEVIDYKNKIAGTNDTVIDPWDFEYWCEKRRQEEFNFDEEELRPYFEVTRVMQGMISIFSDLYEIDINKRPTVYLKNGRKRLAKERNAVEVWHPDVNFFEVYDRETKEHLGSFYTDWHPRDSKRGGAWKATLRTGTSTTGDKPREPHLAVMAGNMTKGLRGKPSLLTHREVQTIFHEFGHLLHQILSDVEIRSLAGTNVARDFVELPSQICENWIWNPDSVNLFSKHYRTGKAIPKDLFDKMIKARNYRSASGFMSQLSIAKMDLELHHHYDRYKNMKIDAADKTILKDYKLPFSQPSPSYMRRLTHAFSSPTGYAAGYYSYKWAEVLEADAFSKFQEEGILNTELGLEFRKTLLSKGNSKPAGELYRDFMGRDPKIEPLLIKFGIGTTISESSDEE